MRKNTKKRGSAREEAKEEEGHTPVREGGGAGGRRETGGEGSRPAQGSLTLISRVGDYQT